jgi:hypothetical protein
MAHRKQDLWTRAAAIAVGCLLAVVATARAQVPGPSPKVDPVGGEAQLYDELARRFSAAQRLFERFSTPEGSRELLEVLVARDAAAFGRLIDGLDLPFAGKCWWAQEMMWKTIDAFDLEAPKVTQCYLRDDLTPEERWMYVLIALRHREAEPVVVTEQKTLEATPAGPVERVAIPPGAFLDELKAVGLVYCETTPADVLFLRPVVGEPFHFCLPDGPPR